MDDLISRQAAIDAIDSFDVFDGYQDKIELKSKIEELPSAKNKAFEEMKAELYEREVQAQADKECYPDNEYLEGVFDGLHEASKLMSIAVPTAEPIIRCKECLMHGVCRFEPGLGLDGYCSQAKRRTDG